jgi:hypothetical protein
MADPAAACSWLARRRIARWSIDGGCIRRAAPPAYVRLLLLAAVLGVPVSAAAYLFLYLMELIQHWVFTDLPGQLGFAAPPLWWPLPPLLVSGVLVALAISRLPGGGGHSPADGFHAGGTPPGPAELPGILLAAGRSRAGCCDRTRGTVDRPRGRPWRVRGPPVPP